MQFWQTDVSVPYTLYSSWLQVLTLSTDGNPVIYSRRRTDGCRWGIQASVECMQRILGRFTGGLATVTIVLCMFFAAVSGSGPATVAAIGSMVIPTMLDKGYSKSFTLALIATAGSIGVIIPPSIPMVIYGVSTSTSISSLFMAGFLPGILIGFSLIVVSYLYCKNRDGKVMKENIRQKKNLQQSGMQNGHY